MGPSIEVLVLRVPGCTTATVIGDLDLSTVGELRWQLQALVRESPALLVIDVGRVGFVDATGLKALVLASLSLSGNGGQVVLRRPSRMLRRMIALLELQNVLPAQP